MKDINKKSEKELRKALGEKREELRGFRFDTAGSKTRDVRAARTLRKDIAQILTELHTRLKEEVS